MAVLLLRLAGPMQSWGTDSKLQDRGSGKYPSKSGVIGLIAAAQGRSREDSVDDLARLPFGVAVCRSGKIIADTQNAIRRASLDYREAKDNERYHFEKRYISDAIFFCGLECDRETAEKIKYDLNHPAFPLFLGRRSCPVTQPLVVGIEDGTLREALIAAVRNDWVRNNWRRVPKNSDNPGLYLESDTGDFIRDIPISFSQKNRRFAGRRCSLQKGVN